MSYEKINFEDNITPLDAENLNHIEDGIAANADDIDTLSADLTDMPKISYGSIAANGGTITASGTFALIIFAYTYSIYGIYMMRSAATSQIVPCDYVTVETSGTQYTITNNHTTGSMRYFLFEAR